MVSNQASEEVAVWVAVNNRASVEAWVEVGSNRDMAEAVHWVEAGSNRDSAAAWVEAVLAAVVSSREWEAAHLAAVDRTASAVV